MTVGFEIQGHLELRKGLERMRGRMLDTVAKEMDKGMMNVEARSKPVTPLRYGLLRAATYTTPARAEGGAITASIYNNQFYAKYVHERKGLIHWTTPGTGPKFIEAPLREAVPEIQESIQKALVTLAKEG
jgi:crotonobetainyl-CoA:carnitine CoA-transferase CaiB-like acyl-CoA transferase